MRCSSAFIRKLHRTKHFTDVDRNGDFLPLKFPAFHHELTTQSFWNAADDLGRIKVVIAEGFPRDSVTLPLERVKNVVVFSFQHAPLG